MKYFIAIALAGMVVYVACDFHSPVDFGLGIQQSAAKRMADSDTCFLVQWDCDHETWETKADSTFSIFYENVRLTTNSTGPPTITEYLDGSSKRVYESGSYARYDRHRAIFRFVGGQCGMWSTAFDDTTAQARIFQGEIEWRYRNLPANSEYVVVEDGVKHRIARVNPDTSLNCTDYWGLYYRNSRPNSLIGRYYTPLNISEEAPIPLPSDDTDIIVNPFLGCSDAPVVDEDDIADLEGPASSSAPYKGMIDAINVAVDESNAHQDCINSGGSWNGTRCVYPTVPTSGDRSYTPISTTINDLCHSAGGVWHDNGKCYKVNAGIDPGSCEDMSGVYSRGSCLTYKGAPDTPDDNQGDCEFNHGTWDGSECTYPEKCDLACPADCPINGGCGYARECYRHECLTEIKLRVPPSGTKAGDCVASGGIWDGSDCDCGTSRGGLNNFLSITVNLTNGISVERWSCCRNHPQSPHFPYHLCVEGSNDGNCTISPGEAYSIICTNNDCRAVKDVGGRPDPKGICADPSDTRCECGYRNNDLGGCVRDYNLPACTSRECTSGQGTWNGFGCSCPSGSRWRKVEGQNRGACQCSNTRSGAIKMAILSLTRNTLLAPAVADAFCPGKELAGLKMHLMARKTCALLGRL